MSKGKPGVPVSREGEVPGAVTGHDGENLAIMDAMSANSPRHGRRALSVPQAVTLAIAVLVVVAGMVIGFLTSFITLESAASREQWAYPALLPLAVDTGILAYVLLDQLAITLGARSRWLHAVAWSLAAFTVWANASLAPADGRTWRVIHAAMPALWVLGVEALRFIWRRLHARDGDGVSDRIPWKRWVLAFRPTFRLWRRMQLWGITSYPEAIDMELSRLHATARLADRYGPGWRGKVPGALTWMLDGGVRMADALAMVESLCAPAPALSPVLAVTRGKRPAAGARRRRAGGRGESIDREVQALAKEMRAVDILRRNPGINGTQMGDELDVSPSRGRFYLQRAKERVALDSGPMPVVAGRSD